MKVVIAMDSFKGSLTSLEAGNAVKRGILRACPDAAVKVLPLADGGEGTIDSIAPYINGISKTITVTGPLGAKIKADYIFDPKSITSFEGRTGPYVLYTAVRLNSILNKVQNSKFKVQKRYDFRD